MALTLAEIRARLQAQQDRKEYGSGQIDKSIFAHWNMPEGTIAKLRFLPDGNDKNPYFWVERALIKLPFTGIKGQADSKPVVVQVPCIEMFPGQEGKCPILAEVRMWFKDKDPQMEELGRKYWKKKSYLMHGFVRENPIKDDPNPENPIRRFIISPQIFNLIKGALLDPELENLPTDYESGLDFFVKKTSKGGYADYSTSSWARKENALSASELAAIETYGLPDLSSYLPKMPNEVELQVMKEMFEASVDGQPYDPSRWSQYFKPFGLKSNDEDAGSSSSVETPATAPSAPVGKVTVVKKTETLPWEEDDEDSAAVAAPVVAPAKTESKKAEDILAMIRNRNKQT